MKKNQESDKNTIVFSRQQILAHNKYKSRADILGILLKDGENYTAANVDALLDEFMKGKVK